VICGGGVIGSSIAMHLAEKGIKNIVLLEQGSLTCGTTWHAAGLVGRVRGSPIESYIVSTSRQLYKDLDEAGYGTGWKECGSLNLCRTHDRKISYIRGLIDAERLGVVNWKWLSPQECQEVEPMVNPEGIEGGFHIEGDGVVNPTDVTMAMAKKAKEMGVKIHEKTKISRVLTDGEKVTGVETDKGTILCDTFVNCAGQWARDLGFQCDVTVKIPLHSCEHFYVVTKAIEGMNPMMPVVRDYDGFIYIREWSGGIMAGGFEPVAKPVFHDGIPDNWDYQLLPEDWDHFQVLLDQMLYRIPAMEKAEVRTLLNGAESFTPDGRMILGEAPELDNYYVAAGMNSVGIASAGGVGKLMAEWIVDGEPSKNCWSLDIRRFVDLHNNKKFLRDRVKESLVLTGAVNYWDTELVGYNTCRKLRASTIYPRMEKDAVFGQFMGYERPLYFNHSTPSEDDDRRWYSKSISTSSDYGDAERAKSVSHEFEETEVPSRGSFGKPVWFEKVKSEYWACRERVCLIDMSTFTKFELRSAGTEVVDFLEYICSNSVDKPVGTIIHTGIQNHKGGYENDCSVVRLAENKYFMIGPTAQQTRAKNWIRDHLPKNGSVQLSDVTSMYTTINVIGPKAQELLEELTEVPLDSKSFPHMTCQEIDVGQASRIKAMRLTHTGENGWILYIPSEYALHVYDTLMRVGKNYGIRNAGYYALRALRTEKFFAYWGTDLTPLTTPLECGREFRVKWDKGGFIGHEALEKQKKEGIRKKLVQLLLEEHNFEEDPWPWGGEPIYRNGQFCGVTSSTAYGFTLDRHICLGYVEDIDPNTKERRPVNNDFILKNAKFEVNIAGKRYPAKANIYAPKLASADIMTDSTKLK